MPSRRQPDTAIADRIRRRRQLRGWSVRTAAALAGIAPSTWSRLERGLAAADNRFTLAAIAQALGCPVADLTGQPAEPTTRAGAETSAQTYDALRAVIAADLTYPAPGPAPALGQLEQQTQLVCDLAARCDFAGALQHLPGVLAGLHAAAAGPGRVVALRGLVLAHDAAAMALRYLGHTTSACLVGDRAQQAAEELGDPVMLGMAAWVRTHAAYGCGLHDRGLQIATHAADQLSRHTGDEHAAEVLGMLMLSQAWAWQGLGRPDDAAGPLAEASRLAEVTGDTDTFWLMFGPANVRFWRVAMEADGPEPGRAVEIARSTSPGAVAKPSRQAAYYIDLGRALVRLGRDADALRMLLAAERTAPQRTREPLVAETARVLLDRAQRRTSPELRAFAGRLGIGT